jgi:hypothetical protein
MRQIETDRTALRQTLSTRDQDLKVCVDHNRALYQLNKEVLTRLDKHSVFSRLAESEPFTQIKRVQLENLVDDYQTRADEQLLHPGKAGASPPAPGIAPAPTGGAPVPPPPASPPAAAPAQPHVPESATPPH